MSAVQANDGTQGPPQPSDWRTLQIRDEENGKGGLFNFDVSGLAATRLRAVSDMTTRLSKDLSSEDEETHSRLVDSAQPKRGGAIRKQRKRVERNPYSKPPTRKQKEEARRKEREKEIMQSAGGEAGGGVWGLLGSISSYVWSLPKMFMGSSGGSAGSAEPEVVGSEEELGEDDNMEDENMESSSRKEEEAVGPTQTNAAFQPPSAPDEESEDLRPVTRSSVPSGPVTRKSTMMEESVISEQDVGSVGSVEYKGELVSEMKWATLRKHMKELGLKMSGTKATLADRLQEHLIAQAQKAAASKVPPKTQPVKEAEKKSADAESTTAPAVSSGPLLQSKRSPKGDMFVPPNLYASEMKEEVSSGVPPTPAPTPILKGSTPAASAAAVGSLGGTSLLSEAKNKLLNARGRSDSGFTLGSTLASPHLGHNQGLGRGDAGDSAGAVLEDFDRMTQNLRSRLERTLSPGGTAKGSVNKMHELPFGRSSPFMGNSAVAVATPTSLDHPMAVPDSTIHASGPMETHSTQAQAAQVTTSTDVVRLFMNKGQTKPTPVKKTTPGPSPLSTVADVRSSTQADDVLRTSAFETPRVAQDVRGEPDALDSSATGRFSSDLANRFKRASGEFNIATSSNRTPSSLQPHRYGSDASAASVVPTRHSIGPSWQTPGRNTNNFSTPQPSWAGGSLKRPRYSPPRTSAHPSSRSTRLWAPGSSHLATPYSDRRQRRRLLPPSSTVSNRVNDSSSFADVDRHTPRRQPRVVGSLPAPATPGQTSATAKRILETLTKISSPLSEARSDRNLSIKSRLLAARNRKTPAKTKPAAVEVLVNNGDKTADQDMPSASMSTPAFPFNRYPSKNKHPESAKKPSAAPPASGPSSTPVFAGFSNQSSSGAPNPPTFSFSANATVPDFSKPSSVGSRTKEFVAPDDFVKKKKSRSERGVKSNRDEDAENIDEPQPIKPPPIVFAMPSSTQSKPEIKLSSSPSLTGSAEQKYSFTKPPPTTDTSIASTETSQKKYTFGGAAKDDGQSSNGTFSFGAPNPPAAAAAAAAAPTPTFSFGMPSKASNTQEEDNEDDNSEDGEGHVTVIDDGSADQEGEGDEDEEEDNEDGDDVADGDGDGEEVADDNEGADSKPVPAKPLGGFQFGSALSKSAFPTPAASSGFTFGAAAKKNTDEEEDEEPAAKKLAPSVPTFTFGGSAPKDDKSKATDSAPKFSFGGAGSAAGVPKFTFGSGDAAATTTAATSAAPASEAEDKLSPAKAPTPSSGFTFSSSNTPSVPQFSFGGSASSAGASGSGAGSSSAASAPSAPSGEETKAEETKPADFASKVGGFTFGASSGSSAPSSTPASSSGFTFGATPASSAAESTSGALSAAASASASASSPTAPLAAFSSSSTPATASSSATPSSGFTFGAASGSSTPAFTSSTSDPSSTPATAASTPGFTFGAAASSSAAAPSSSTAPASNPFSNTPAPASSGGFVFGAATPATPAATTAGGGDDMMESPQQQPAQVSAAPPAFTLGSQPSGAAAFSASASSQPATGGFTFSAGSSAPTAASSASTGGFGFAAPATPAAPAASTGGFQFSAGSAASNPSTQGGFSFSASSSQSAAAPAGGFGFSAASTPQSTPGFGAATQAASAPFQFGAASQQQAAAPAAPPTFGAPAGAAGFGAPTGAAGFGTPAASTQSFGAGAASTPAFGQSPAPAGAAGFGQAPASSPFAFGAGSGQPAAQPGQPAFGQAAPAFGAGAPGQPQAPAAFGGFGAGAPAASPSPAFGAGAAAAPGGFAMGSTGGGGAPGFSMGAAPQGRKIRKARRPGK